MPGGLPLEPEIPLPLLTLLCWRRLRVPLLISLLPSIALLAFFLRKYPAREAPLLYRSCAKLLISPSSRGPEHDFYSLTDQRTLLELLRDQEFLEQTVQRSGLSTSWTELLSQLQVTPSGHRENKVDMLELNLTGRDPDQLKKLATSLVSCLTERMRQLTVIEQDRALAYLRREQKRAQQQLQRSWRQWRRHGIRVDRTDALRMNQLQASVNRLETELNQLDLSPTATPPEGPLEAEFARQHLNLAQLRNVYLEQSPLVREQSGRLRRLSLLVRHSQARAAARVRRLGQLRRSSLQRQLQRVQAELEQLQRRQPAVQQVLRSSTLERELQMWQTNLDSLSQQLLAARFAREQNAARLTLVVIEKPQRGQPLDLPSTRLLAWQLWLKRLPESLFFGLILAFAIHYLRGQFKIEARIEEALELPVLGRIPRMSGELCREWERIKHARTQEPGGGL